ncbi:hypothetical protein [Embleya sp. NPDC059237]|uniref:hypothetical protein n=1 Tax=Embleya sp. NPDC059237 TaxID=3346784 RepID=UPI00369C6F86
MIDSAATASGVPDPALAVGILLLGVAGAVWGMHGALDLRGWRTRTVERLHRTDSITLDLRGTGPTTDSMDHFFRIMGWLMILSGAGAMVLGVIGLTT